jgi:23S rRNA (adenine2503-C2)-methyltransferase
MREIKSKSFKNGVVYLLETDDGYLVEVTDTFLPLYTKDAIGNKQNTLTNHDLGDRSERWLIGVSCMSGCPVRCKFCATGKLKKFRNLTRTEICDQVHFILGKHNRKPSDSAEFKINYTRMGEPFMNIDSVKGAIKEISHMNPDTHHYISTIGIKGSDFSWVENNITLQVSLHSLDEDRRNWLIPNKNKMSIEELGQIRTLSNLKTTVNLTLVDEGDFNIIELKKHFDPDFFFIKLSPINQNDISDKNLLGAGIVKSINLI